MDGNVQEKVATPADEGLMAKGTQGMDRIDMMNPANLAQAAQNFN